MAIEEHAERLLRYRASGDSQDSYAAPPMSQSSPLVATLVSPSHPPADMAPRRGGGEGEGSGQPSASFLTVEQHGPRSTDDDGHGHIVHGKVQPMGPPAGHFPYEVAITKVIMVTTTVVQIENHRKRGRSPVVKVKTKSKTDTHTEERVVVGPVPDSDVD